MIINEDISTNRKAVVKSVQFMPEFWTSLVVIFVVKIPLENGCGMGVPYRECLGFTQLIIHLNEMCYTGSLCRVDMHDICVVRPSTWTLKLWPFL